MLKRAFDLVLASMALTLLSPIIFVVWLLVRSRLGVPVFFQQARPGLNGAIFKVYKFRTMLDAVGADGEQLADELRMTRFGAFLRSTSLDELPGLWNVVKGDMSLVGPRPLLVEYLPLYNERQLKRHTVRPGVTGWAQVNGRNSLSWDDKFELDVWYVENQSFWLDAKILLLTIKKVIKRDGISAEGEATMKKFKGSKK